MKKVLWVAMAIAGSVQAADVQVPCEDYQRVMNVRTACEVRPVVSVDAERWRARLHKLCLREQGVAAWDEKARTVCADTAPPVEPERKAMPGELTECKPGMPPWRQPKGMKC